MDKIDLAINYLKDYNQIKEEINLSKEDTLRALMNITMPTSINDDFYRIQDDILQTRLKKQRIVDANDILEISPKIGLWLGDITTIKADAIVNACNCKLLGCFVPLHSCIDNAIHSFAGLQVRRDLMKIMTSQGHDEENGKVKITKAYNLPSSYIMHTVGPIVNKIPSKQDAIDLQNCYLSCLKMADEYKLKTIVFCSIATGLYGYPINDACLIAVNSVKNYLEHNSNTTIAKVIFNVFNRSDYEIYDRTIKKMVK